MQQTLILRITSLLSILFMTFHLSSDAVRARIGSPEAGGSTLVAVPVLVVWLYATLLPGERRSGFIIMLIGSLIALGMPAMHARSADGIFHGDLRKAGEAFFFIWTLHVLAITGMFSLILAVRALIARPRAAAQ